MANENGKTVFPMIPESNWWSIRNQFKKTLPSTVTPNYLKSLLGLTTEQAARNLLSPLKIMGIINEDGTPTALANDWRNDSKYPEVCAKIISTVYSSELLDLFPDNDVDRQKAVEWFMSTAQLGDSAAKKVATLFILLKEAIVKSESASSPASQKSKSDNKPKSTSDGKKQTGVSQTQNDLSVATSHQIPNKKDISMHIDLQIHISPEASADQIDAIFASMAKHLYK